MCGVFFAYSSNTGFIREIQRGRENDVVRVIQPRGPDLTSIVREKNFVAIHTLLSITGYAVQPVVRNGNLLLFNGEIYNDWQTYDTGYSDTDFLVRHLGEHGLEAFDRLDGEFAVIVYRPAQARIVLTTDPFATKPLYYQLGPDYCLIGSYDGAVRACGRDGPVRKVPANTQITIDLKRYEVVSTGPIRNFDFSNQAERSFERWKAAFTRALLKRTRNTRHKCFVALSSGHDSGLIAAELARHHVPFTTYTIEYGEDEKILNERIRILRDEKVDCRILRPSAEDYAHMRAHLLASMEPFLLANPDNPEGELPEKDIRVIPGYIAAAVINQSARRDGNLISLSGQGADEITSDYYNEYSHSRKSEIRGRWENVRGPWKNFQGGWNSLYLEGTERISGNFGIETRYPFLDYEVVQEFINLHPSLKAECYKAPITRRLEELGFPLHPRKLGFAGYPAESRTG